MQYQPQPFQLVLPSLLLRTSGVSVLDVSTILAARRHPVRLSPDLLHIGYTRVLDLGTSE
jgi:hypothetical protein